MVDILPANEGKALKQFIALPRVLYQNLPGYTPPLDIERGQLLHPKKAAFFEHGEAAYFLAMRNGQLVGRISAQIDRRYQSQPGNSDVGFFGCLDAVDDREVINALIKAAELWLSERGLRYMQGPFLLDFNGEPGLMVEGQMAPPMILAPWHPSYLEEHLLNAGFSRIKDLNYFLFELGDNDPFDGEKARLFLDRRPELKVRNLRLERLLDEAAITVELYNDAWSDNWGFVPLEVAEIEGMLKTLKPLLHADNGIFVETNGEPAAGMILIPNVNALVSDLGGSPSLMGWLKLAARFIRNDVPSARIILMGISKRYRRSPMASVMLLAMIYEIAQRRQNHKLDLVEAGWVLEDNAALMKLFEHFQVPKHRTYRLFKMSLPGN